LVAIAPWTAPQTIAQVSFPTLSGIIHHSIAGRQPDLCQCSLGGATSDRTKHGAKANRAKPSAKANRAKPNAKANRAKPNAKANRAKPNAKANRAKPSAGGNCAQHSARGNRAATLSGNSWGLDDRK
jgi:hypothetical protein